MLKKDYIENPIKLKDWDPTKGDFISKQAIEEDKLYLNRKNKKKITIAFLTLIHVAFLFLIFLFY